MLEINDRDFRNGGSLEEFGEKAIVRYQELSMKIGSFKLTCRRSSASYDISRNLIVGAMKAGATNIILEFSSSMKFKSPLEVLGSKTLLRLDVCRCEIGEDHVIICPRLKFLSLKYVTFRNSDSERFMDIMSTTCCDSLEELTLSNCEGLKPRRVREFHNLRRLTLSCVKLHSMFFVDFASKFHCLKDLALLNCFDWYSVDISSTSLKNIRFETLKDDGSTFYAPNIRKFTYVDTELPSSSLIKGGPGEWELDMSVSFEGLYESSWFSELKGLLTKLRPSRITSLQINLELRTDIFNGQYLSSEHEVGAEGEGPVVAVEHLKINATPSSLCCELLIRLLRVFRPKFVTHDWLVMKPLLFDVVLCKRLTHQQICPCCRVPNQKVFGQLKKVNMEVYFEFFGESRPLVLEEPLRVIKSRLGNLEVRFELIWD